MEDKSEQKETDDKSRDWCAVLWKWRERVTSPGTLKEPWLESRETDYAFLTSRTVRIVLSH